MVKVTTIGTLTKNRVQRIRETIQNCFLPLKKTDTVWIGTISELKDVFDDCGQTLQEFHDQILTDADGITYHGSLPDGTEVYTSDAEKIVLVII